MDFDTTIQKIEKALAVNRNGLTIHQIMENTGLARGTVKTYLDELISMTRVHEEKYGQNTKVYFLNGLGKYQQSVPMFEKGYDKGILYVDVMTDPWRNPFIRVKFRRKKKDIGSIYISNEEAVDKLIDVLQKVKPKLKEYRELVTKLEQKEKDT